ncbi:hypothetical protein [Paenibacillus xylanexedens]|uniref:hypothetical protein n=1 Tax=Paenibacillus xylanexedens TaxID=528191 RepID=UPI0011A34E2B|nr:hypothetical protein [Paenibacillus xylanexedens]
MSNAKIVSFIGVTLFTLVVSGCAATNAIVNSEEENAPPQIVKALQVKTDDNPIDQAFGEDFETASATTEINYVANAYLEAWEAEWNHILVELKKHYEHPDDINTLTKYKNSYEKFVEQASDLERIDWSDTSVAPGPDRTEGTGARSASLLEEAELLKRQVLHLIDNYFYDSSEYGEYIYLYQGNGAELDLLR